MDQHFTNCARDLHYCLLEFPSPNCLLDEFRWRLQSSVGSAWNRLIPTAIDADNDRDPDNLAPCKRGKVLMVDINICIGNSLDCNTAIHLIRLKKCCRKYFSHSVY